MNYIYIIYILYIYIYFIYIYIYITYIYNFIVNEHRQDKSKLAAYKISTKTK